MKELQGNASAVVDASQEACLALLAAVDRYPDWHPEVVRSVEVLERDATGQPTRVRAQLHLAQGPLARDFDLLMTVAVQPPSQVSLHRVREDAADAEEFDVTWHVEEQTQIRLDLRANLSVPRFLPIGGIGEAVAEGFVAAAARALVSD